MPPSPLYAYYYWLCYVLFMLMTTVTVMHACQLGHKPHTSKCIICPLSKCKSLLHDCSYKTHCGCMLWCSPGSTDYICCPHVPMLAQARAHNSPLCVCVSFTGFEILELEVGSNQLLADSSSCCTQLHLLYTHHEHLFLTLQLSQILFCTG